MKEILILLKSFSFFLLRNLRRSRGKRAGKNLGVFTGSTLGGTLTDVNGDILGIKNEDSVSNDS